MITLNNFNSQDRKFYIVAGVPGKYSMQKKFLFPGLF